MSIPIVVRSTANQAAALLPGLLLSGAVAGTALGLQFVEVAWFGRPWIESLVLAIVLGAALHSAFGLHRVFHAGIRFAAKTLLEIAIVLLGASISGAAIGAAGAALVGAIGIAVFAALAASYAIGRLLGLSARLATLVACGNSICGNSAIVAAAPVIGAPSKDVAAAIAFTAALGIFVILLLPLVQVWLAIDGRHFGILAGMTVYAVPQVIAATAPAGLLSTQVGTLVKLIRVLMLGPVIVVLGLLQGRAPGRSVPLGRLVPWFILGFLATMLCRSLQLVPAALLAPLQTGATVLTIVSMAALGLSVNVRSVAHAGGRVLLAGALSLAALAAISTVMIFVLHIG